MNRPGVSRLSDVNDVNAKDASNGHQKRSAVKIHRRLRFGLLELMLATAAVASWIPATMAMREIPDLQTEIAVMEKATLQLRVDDTSKLTIRAMPTVWRGLLTWKVYVPERSDLELRFASEGIESNNQPDQYDAVPLSAGKHLIHVKSTTDASGVHGSVLLDGETVLEQHHPPGRLRGSVSSGSTLGIKESKSFSVDETVVLTKQRFNRSHPLRQFGSFTLPPEYGSRGFACWISPAAKQETAPRRFILKRNRSRGIVVGLRQGLRISEMEELGYPGLIDIRPSRYAVLGDEYWDEKSRFAISVVPISGNGKDEVQNGVNRLPTSPQMNNAHIALKSPVEGEKSNKVWTAKSKFLPETLETEDSLLRVFANFNGHASEASVEVEVFFDPEEPNRVGFLPRIGDESIPLRAIELQTHFNSRFFWRTIDVLPTATSSSDADQVDTESVATDQLSVDENVHRNRGNSASQLPWRKVRVNRLPFGKPLKTTAGYRQLILRTDVPDVTQLKYPMGLSNRWTYDGIPNEQVWFLPDVTTGPPDERISVSLRNTAFFPATQSKLPGGSAVGNVRIRIPLPAKKPVWMSIRPAPPYDQN